MSKLVLQDQLIQFKQALRESSDTTCAGEWDTNVTLKEEFDKFCAVLPKGSTRSIMLQMLDNYVQGNSNSPQKWIEYFQQHQYCDDLISSMRPLAQEGHRIELNFERHPEVKLNPAILAAEPIGTLEQKKQRLQESKARTDVIFKDLLTEKENKELSYICSNPKCKQVGHIKQMPRHTSLGGDESGIIAERCSICGSKMTHG